ncbi:hypothetical protein Trydic_g21169 [Trypoxylus dichotomus]
MHQYACIPIRSHFEEGGRCETSSGGVGNNVPALLTPKARPEIADKRRNVRSNVCMRAWGEVNQNQSCVPSIFHVTATVDPPQPAHYCGMSLSA